MTQVTFNVAFLLRRWDHNVATDDEKMICVQIDDFADGGRIATISPSLWIALEPGRCHPMPAYSTGTVCHACGRAITSSACGYHRRGQFEPAERVLRCHCLTVIHNPDVIAESSVTENWPEFRRMKRLLETELVATDSPEQN